MGVPTQNLQNPQIPPKLLNRQHKAFSNSVLSLCPYILEDHNLYFLAIYNSQSKQLPKQSIIYPKEKTTPIDLTVVAKFRLKKGDGPIPILNK